VEKFYYNRTNFSITGWETGLRPDATTRADISSGACMPLSWDEMLDEFRALGGTAENICLKQGRFGRGLFAQDPSKQIRVRVPESLLLELKHAELETGAFRVAAKAPMGARERRFLENYQRDFAWGVGRAGTEELLRMIQAAPAELRELLKTPFNADLWLVAPTGPAVLERYLGTRIINYKNTWRIMPVVELANHGHNTIYDTSDGVRLAGNFEDEILAEYRVGDPWMIFSHWGFASEEPAAMSLVMKLKDKVGEIVIERASMSPAPDRVPFFPEVSVAGNALKLSYLMLGHKKYPRLARAIFRRIMREACRPDADEVFEHIQHVNRIQFLKLSAASEDAPPVLGRLLRDVVRRQLEAMSCSVGVREL